MILNPDTPTSAMKPIHIGVALWALAIASANAAGLDDWLDDLSENLLIATADDSLHVELSGYVELDLFAIDGAPPGLLFTTDDTLIQPRLTLDLDIFAGRHLSLSARARADRGLDPGLAEDGEIRLDEAIARLTLGNHQVQFGKFPSVFGSWLRRSEPYKNPFIPPPSAYDNFTIVFDARVQPTVDAWLMARDRTDVKTAWVPVIWGQSYTVGSAVSGSAGRFDYALSVKNRSLSSRPAVWDDIEFDHAVTTARLGYRPDPGWELGASVSTGPYLQERIEPDLPPGTDSDDFDQNLAGVDVSWSHGAWQTWAELIVSEFEIPNIGAVDVTSYYLSAQYRWRPRVRTALRWNHQIFSDVTRLDGSRVAWDRDHVRVDAVLGYDVTRHASLTLQYSHSNQAGDLEQGQHLGATRVLVTF